MVTMQFVERFINDLDASKPKVRVPAGGRPRQKASGLHLKGG
jgi:hypothetical protein